MAGGLFLLSVPALAQAETAIGLDVSVDGNTATVVGPVESCISVTKDETFDVDLYVRDVEDLLAWTTYVAYDSAVVQVIDRDVQHFQAADEGSTVFDGSEDVPSNDDGLFRVEAADTRPLPVGDTGSGVLARLTLKAISEGRTELNPGHTDHDGDGKPDFGTTLTNIDGERIGDTDGDSFFDGDVSVPEIFVDMAPDRDCGASNPGSEATAEAENPGQEQTSNTDDGGGTSWWVFALIAAGVIALLAAVLYGAGRLRRGPSAGSGGQ
jgi:hypothetical protein